ncbi:glycosyltransferase involved in cell wall biosynthesis [Mariniflexile fucanivorans]|uniref:Glycosyltransferase involved in cell wall biosynthesis n=1 Tax=Mariniflexile fucanivorans TaxID=264023 RepID=A0A4R1RDE9_9FLAO|nr:glycosyltransferase [Mariniflexile fucanivorans]TCL63898.1 glycosyltransferase involved in cell wall biosynthesis [Mariniflexile fucanivorans]
MKFLVITNAPTLQQDQMYAAYAPYVKEMDIWFKYVDDVAIISPTKYNQPLLKQTFKKQPTVISIPLLVFTSFKNTFSSVIRIPIILWTIFKACKKADHIHLRCPGNIGLLGCFVQILFPKKPKTAKYAGNWDPEAKQPVSYKLQKWILSNTFLTRNMQVLVYGDWNNQTKNIKPFFTASYSNSEKEMPQTRDYLNKLNFVFVGSLVEGKRPLLAIKIVEALQKQGNEVQLDLYGDGILKDESQKYISNNHLENFIKLHGNQEKKVVKEALKNAHFLMLLSKSEGWPKAVAEAMFFGAIPITTSVSCIPFMLNGGERGIIVDPELLTALKAINKAVDNTESLKRMSKLASNWSQNYTLEVFESEISKLLNNV